MFLAEVISFSNLVLLYICACKCCACAINGLYILINGTDGQKLPSMEDCLCQLPPRQGGLNNDLSPVRHANMAKKELMVGGGKLGFIGMTKR